MSNNGPDAATGLAATLRLPRALSPNGTVTGGTYNFNSGILTLALPSTTLASSASQTITVTFTAPANTQPLSGKVSSTASSTDPTPGNNDGSASAAALTTLVTLPQGQCGGTSYDGQPSTQGLYAEYFKGDSINGTRYSGVATYFTNRTPNLTRTDANLNFFTRQGGTANGTVIQSNWGDIMSGANHLAQQPEYFSVRERGYLVITTAGNYTFTGSVDDNATLYLGSGATATPPTGTTIKLDGSQSVALPAGATPIQVHYGNGVRNSLLVLSYSGPDTNNQTTVIPNGAFCSAQRLSGPLPVTLVNFTATAAGRQVALAWQTAQEWNSLRFDVERSADGHTFATVGEVAAQGTSATGQRYNYTDAQPGPAGTIRYYRLRQVDTDGSATYSPVQVVTLAAGPALTLYPVPVREQLHVDLSPASPLPAVFRVYDATGAVVLTKETATTEPTSLDVHILPGGLYLLRVQLATAYLTQSFTKQ